MTSIALLARTSAVLAAATLAACRPAGASHETQAAKPEVPPAPPVAAALPAAPAWAQPFMGKIITQLLPQKETCVGNADHRVARFTGSPGGSEVDGWGWDKEANRPIARVLLTDETLRVWGAGEPGGPPRSDVAEHLPEVKGQETGWRGFATGTSGLTVAYGLIDDGKAICPLGEIEL